MFIMLAVYCRMIDIGIRRIWSGSSTEEADTKGPVYYIVIYGAVSTALQYYPFTMTHVLPGHSHRFESVDLYHTGLIIF